MVHLSGLAILAVACLSLNWVQVLGRRAKPVPTLYDHFPHPPTIIKPTAEPEEMTTQAEAEPGDNHQDTQQENTATHKYTGRHDKNINVNINMGGGDQDYDDDKWKMDCIMMKEKLIHVMNRIHSIEEERGPCPEGFTHWNEHCYMMSNFNTTRNEAKQYCNVWEANLVSIETQQENFWLKAWYQSKNFSTSVWTSGKLVSAAYMWMLEQDHMPIKMEYEYWAMNQSNSSSSSHSAIHPAKHKSCDCPGECVIMAKDQNNNATWHMASCYAAYAFVCEKKAMQMSGKWKKELMKGLQGHMGHKSKTGGNQGKYSGYHGNDGKSSGKGNKRRGGNHKSGKV